ncbi:MAG: hypothetical protein EBY97_06390, partial [Burkholderiaceae bacterium]|nr:hypothetical protein [Burkholderiaceae bacterium]
KASMPMVMNAAKRYVRAFQRVYPGESRTGPNRTSVELVMPGILCRSMTLRQPNPAILRSWPKAPAH